MTTLKFVKRFLLLFIDFHIFHFLARIISDIYIYKYDKYHLDGQRYNENVHVTFY